MAEPLKVINWQLLWSGTAYAITPLVLQGTPGTLDAVSLLLPAGAYTTLRTYRHSRAIRFHEHLDRLVDSAERARVAVSLPLPPLRAAVRDVVRQSPFPEARVRISLDLTDTPGRLFVSLEQLQLLPAQAYETGVRTVSRALHRDNPQAKLTNFIATAAGYRAQLPHEINEMLMISAEGILLEGLSSNFFGISAGVLRSANEGVLLGITRSVVLDLARAAAIALDLRGVRLSDLPALDESFITSASRGVLPVVQIDDRTIGTGRPGALTRKLMRGFADWVERAAEEI